MKRKAGRPKGSPNKKTWAQKLEIEDKLQAMGCDPIIGMARIALDCEKELAILDDAINSTNDAAEKAEHIRCKNTHITQAGAMYKELAQYVAPKRKAVEMTGQDGGPVQINKIERVIVD